MEAIIGLDAWKTRLPVEESHLATCVAVEMPCGCPTADDLKAEAAEARFDAQREG